MSPMPATAGAVPLNKKAGRLSLQKGGAQGQAMRVGEGPQTRVFAAKLAWL